MMRFWRRDARTREAQDARVREAQPVSPVVTAQPPQPRTAQQPATDTLGEASEFLRMFHEESGQRDSLPARWSVVAREIEDTGTYRHTNDELVWGARVGWRQSVRCMGRIRWRNLVVRDARDVTSLAQVADQLAEHIRYGTNNGKIRSTITIFPQDGPTGPRLRIWNEQLIRYAGYAAADGTIVGDPRYADFTTMVTNMGWQPPAQPGRFDILPWVLESDSEPPTLFTPPIQDILEVDIAHPAYPWMAKLGLKWHALPAVSCMRLRIGGVNYSAAPFNGWYVGDEVATRDFGDTERYNMLPAIAEKLGLDTSSEATFWRQRAAVELNIAVHHSFTAAGVSIVDAVSESNRFAEFARREEASGRICYANWSWVNGHFAPSLGEAFHRTYDSTEPNPNYWLDPDARQRALGQCPVRPFQDAHDGPH